MTQPTTSMTMVAVLLLCSCRGQTSETSTEVRMKQTSTKVSMKFQLDSRRGPKPKTQYRAPHQQLSDNSPPEIYVALAHWLFELGEVREGRSQFSLPSARAAFTLNGVRQGMNPEFTHIHTEPGPGSQHLGLSRQDAEAVLAAGWGELHPLNDRIPNQEMLLIYAPRDLDELETVKKIVVRARAFAEN